MNVYSSNLSSLQEELDELSGDRCEAPPTPAFEPSVCGAVHGTREHRDEEPRVHVVSHPLRFDCRPNVLFENLEELLVAARGTRTREPLDVALRHGSALFENR